MARNHENIRCLLLCHGKVPESTFSLDTRMPFFQDEILLRQFSSFFYSLFSCLLNELYTYLSNVKVLNRN